MGHVPARLLFARTPDAAQLKVSRFHVEYKNPAAPSGEWKTCLSHALFRQWQYSQCDYTTLPTFDAPQRNPLERCEIVLYKCENTLLYGIPTLVDDVDDAVSKAYAGDLGPYV